MKIDVVLLAAGQNQRFGDQSKVLASLGGRPVITYPLSFFTRQPEVQNIILVTRADLQAQMEAIALAYRRRRPIFVVEGGETRGQSVRAGLQEVREDYVLVHDGARPLLYEEDYRALLDALRDYDAVSLGTPVRDALGRSIDGQFLGAILRDNAYHLFTPQAFRTEVLVAAHRWAAARKAEFVEDLSLAALFTGKTRVVETYNINWKVTFPEDLEICQRLLSGSE